MLNLKRQLVFGSLNRRRYCLRTILSTDSVSSSVIKRADFGWTCMADFLPIRLLKKSVQDFFNQAKQKCDFCFASFFKHLRVRKMAVGPSTAPQGVEKRVFQQPANGP